MIENNLRTIRENLKIKPVEMAARVGLPETQYRKYESDKTNPSLPVALKISHRLNISVNEIWMFTEDAEKID